MRQNNLTVARFDDLWIGNGSLTVESIIIGVGRMQWKSFNLFKERPKIRPSHVSIKKVSRPTAFVSWSEEHFATPKLD